MKIILASFLAFCLLSGFVYQEVNRGEPYQNKMQQIPGRVECEFYNTGGEGIAYHDSDSINNGSGKLNPANGEYLHEFRMHEGVDISYTKTGNIDNNPYNKVPRDMGKLYVGWTVPGEWLNYTVNVVKAGKYSVGLMYTANGDGTIALAIDGKYAAKDLKVPSTHNDADTVKWRQWHHWNKAGNLVNIHLKKGVHVLTLYVTGNGNMNFDYMEFKRLINK